MDSLVFLQLMLRSKRSLGRGSRIPPRRKTDANGEIFFGLGGQVGLMLALFSALGPLLGASWTHVAFFLRCFAISGDFGPTLDGLGRIWGEFGEGFCLDF